MTASLKVLHTPAATDKANPDVIDLLEAALVKARSGEVTGVVILLRDDSGLGHYHAGIDDRFEAIGYLHHAIHKLHIAD